VYPFSLDDLGWNDHFAKAFEEIRTPLDSARHRPGLEPARVSLEHTHIYRVLTAAGERLARVAGRLRHAASARADFPAVGDWVVLDTPAAGDTRDVARIRAVLPRVSRFSRRAAGDVTEEQVVAANIDVVFLVSGLDGDFNPRRIERYLVTAWESGASPVILLNKADLVDDADAMAREVEELAQGVPVHAISATQAHAIDRVRQYLTRGRTAALLGMSGVGKSSIANALLGEARLRTHDVREWDSRGRHTTSGRQLVLVPGGGILIDTPGMRELQLWEPGEAIAGAFADVEALAEECRFRDCRHASEPGCAVLAAVAAGMLPDARLESFRKLQSEQAYQSRQQDERGRIETKRIGRIGAKAIRQVLREKDKERGR
jgi:ribosome biogenesis GTPase